MNTLDFLVSTTRHLPVLHTHAGIAWRAYHIINNNNDNNIMPMCRVSGAILAGHHFWRNQPFTRVTDSITVLTRFKKVHQLNQRSISAPFVSNSKMCNVWTHKRQWCCPVFCQVGMLYDGESCKKVQDPSMMILLLLHHHLPVHTPTTLTSTSATAISIALLCVCICTSHYNKLTCTISNASKILLLLSQFQLICCEP